VRLAQKYIIITTNIKSEIKSKVSVYPEIVSANNSYENPIIILIISLFLVMRHNIRFANDFLGSLRLNMILTRWPENDLEHRWHEIIFKNRKKKLWLLDRKTTSKVHLKYRILLDRFLNVEGKKKIKNVTNHINF
jgi:hypothetical protein